MEPPVDYGNTYQSQSPYESRKVYGRSRKLFGCFGLIGFLIIAVIVVVIFIVFAYPALTPNKLRGDFLNATIVADKNNNVNLWVLADGSFTFIKETKSPGRHSVGRSCIFCKTYTYIYNPSTGEVIKKFKTDYEDIIIQPDIFTVKDKVWVINKAYGENPTVIEVYDGSTGELTMDIKGLEKKYSELSSGITEVFYFSKPIPYLKLATRDGQNDITLDLNNEKIYNTFSDLTKSIEEKDNKEISVFALGNEKGSTQRKKLYLVTGPSSKLRNTSNIESYLDNPSSLKFFANSTAELLTPNKSYIEPLVLYSDKNICIILQQEVADKDSDRMITCVDKTGRVKWVIPQAILFEEARVSKDDPFSSTFFMKDKFDGQVSGNIFMFKLEHFGVIGFDLSNGNKLWELEF